MQKSNVEADVYNKSKNCDRGKKVKKEKLKSLIRFHSANKINNYNGGVGGWGDGGWGRWGGGGVGGRKGKNSKRINRTSQNIRINVFLESLLSEFFHSLGVTVHLTSLGCPPTLC